MIKVNVKPGICGLDSEINVEADDMGMNQITIETKCSYIRNIANEMKEIDGVAECFEKFNTSEIYEMASRHCKHLACPVPCAIIKGIEAASGLALPKDVEIRIQKI